MSPNSSFCFCTLALGTKYRHLAKDLATSLAQYSPGTVLVVGTDRPNDFKDCSNVLAFKLQQRGILLCFHDKRFVIKKALQHFQTAIQIDADTQLTGQLPTEISPTGLAAIHLENLVEHTEKYNPERSQHLQKLSQKLDLEIAQVQYVGESLFAISASDPSELGGANRATEFLKQWDQIAQYLELHGIHAGEGNAIGLAAAKAGLEITQPDWLTQIDQVRKHFDAASETQSQTLLERQKKRLQYHYRFNKTRLRSLLNFKFYYQ